MRYIDIHQTKYGYLKEMSLNIKKGFVFVQFIQSQIMFIHNSLSYLSLDRIIVNIGLGSIQTTQATLKLLLSINNPLLDIIKSRKKWISIN